MGSGTDDLFQLGVAMGKLGGYFGGHRLRICPGGLIHLQNLAATPLEPLGLIGEDRSHPP